jgi:hypothetical protein
MFLFRFFIEVDPQKGHVHALALVRVFLRTMNYQKLGESLHCWQRLYILI